MVDSKLKKISRNIINIKLTDSFKYESENEFFDDLEIYEEAFDYAYFLVRGQNVICSNFNIYKSYKKNLFEYLKGKFNDDENGYIYRKLYEFFFLIDCDDNIIIE